MFVQAGAYIYKVIFTDERVIREAQHKIDIGPNRDAHFKSMWDRDNKVYKGLLEMIDEGKAMVTDAYKVYFLIEDEEKEEIMWNVKFTVAVWFYDELNCTYIIYKTPEE